MTEEDFEIICDTFTNYEIFQKDLDSNLIKINKKPILIKDIN